MSVVRTPTNVPFCHIFLWNISAGELTQNSAEKYNKMVQAKQWTKTYPKDDKILALTTRLSKLDKNSVLATFKGGGGNRIQNHTKNKGSN